MLLASPGSSSHARGYLDMNSRSPQRAGLVLALALHAAALAVLLNWEPARSALVSVAPIMVNLITPPTPEPPRREPKLLPIRAQESSPALPLIAAATETPTTVVAPPQPEAHHAAPSIETPLVLAPTLAPVIPPRFDAAYLDNPAPSYPALARRMREQGKVMLRVLVSRAGTAERVEIRSGSGSERLDQAALQTVARWRFVPAKQGTEAVSAWVLVPISFSLEG